MRAAKRVVLVCPRGQSTSTTVPDGVSMADPADNAAEMDDTLIR